MSKGRISDWVEAPGNAWAQSRRSDCANATAEGPLGAAAEERRIPARTLQARGRGAGLSGLAVLAVIKC